MNHLHSSPSAKNKAEAHQLRPSVQSVTFKKHQLKKNRSELPVSNVGIKGRERLFKQMWAQCWTKKGALTTRNNAGIL